MLFAFQPTRACIFDISADQNVWLRSALRSLRLYGNSLFCDRLRLFAICDRLRSYGNQPLDRTWFYLLRSSAITIAGSQAIAEVFPFYRRRSLDCSQSPYFSVGFSRPVCFDGAAAILVCKSERDLGRLSKLPRGGEWSWRRRENFFRFPSPTILTPTPAPLGSLDTLPRSHSLLQTKMAAVPSKRTGLENPTEK